jgi:hypothetical protein
MQADAIMRVSEAIKARLDAALSARFGLDQTFIGPLDDPGAAGKSLVLFLFRVVPNPDLRNVDHIGLSADPIPKRVVYENALPLDLYYLLADNSAAGSQEPFVPLGIALQELGGSTEIRGTQVDGETVRLTIDPISNEEMGRVWTLFPTENYRTSVIYIASPVWIDPVAPIAGAQLVQNYDHTSPDQAA